MLRYGSRDPAGAGNRTIASDLLLDALHRSRPRALAYRVEPISDEVVETPLEISYLGERVAEPAAA